MAELVLRYDNDLDGFRAITATYGDTAPEVTFEAQMLAIVYRLIVVELGPEALERIQANHAGHHFVLDA